ncbi:MinD/ParA family protein [Alkalihalobacillus oceani]|uniref:MinD/ParA family protein n=1 Tax=Halalkalibacter oceani TaxID=1653776 RepID=A0A9X2IR55_9BACI|nr:MinD/ParA family protein [Halalkalibacter oceani]
MFPLNMGLDTLANDLEENNYVVNQKDTSLDTFSAWAQSDDSDEAECALIYGLAVVSKGESQSTKQAVFERLKEVRRHREKMRLILLFPEEYQYDKEFVRQIAQLLIYDLHFVQKINTEDICNWIETPKTYTYLEAVLDGYRAESDRDAQPAIEMDWSEEQEDNYRKKEVEEKPSLKEKLASKRERVKETRSRRDRRENVGWSPKKEHEIRMQYRSFASKVIVVTSTKGGIGKTDISLNLAAAIKEHTESSKMVVVDFDFPYGGLGAALKLPRTSHLGDWLFDDHPKLTEEAIKNKVVSYEGIDFIPMAFQAKDSMSFLGLQAEILIDTLKRYYDIVIMDTSGFSEAAVSAIERASEVILLTSHDVVSLSNAYAYKEDLIRRIGIDFQKISVFINQVPETEDISKQKIAEMFEDDEEYSLPIIGFAPFDDVVRQYRNKGAFLYAANPLHSFAEGIDMILESLQIVPKESIKQRRKQLERQNSKLRSLFSKN